MSWGSAMWGCLSPSSWPVQDIASSGSTSTRRSWTASRPAGRTWETYLRKRWPDSRPAVASLRPQTCRGCRKPTSCPSAFQHPSPRPATPTSRSSSRWRIHWPRPFGPPRPSSWRAPPTRARRGNCCCPGSRSTGWKWGRTSSSRSARNGWIRATPSGALATRPRCWGA